MSTSEPRHARSRSAGNIGDAAALTNGTTLATTNANANNTNHHNGTDAANDSEAETEILGAGSNKGTPVKPARSHVAARSHDLGRDGAGADDRPHAGMKRKAPDGTPGAQARLLRRGANGSGGSGSPPSPSPAKKARLSPEPATTSETAVKRDPEDDSDGFSKRSKRARSHDAEHHKSRHEPSAGRDEHESSRHVSADKSHSASTSTAHVKRQASSEHPQQAPPGRLEPRSRSASPSAQHERSTSLQSGGAEPERRLRIRRTPHAHVPPPTTTISTTTLREASEGAGHDSPTASSNFHMPSRSKDVDGNGATSFARACERGADDVVRQMLEESHDDIERADNGGNRPLQKAALAGHEAVVQLLVEAGCEVNIANDPDESDGDTPLIDAIENGHVEIVKLLLDAGANPWKKNADYKMPKDCLASKALSPEVRQQISALLDESAVRHLENDNDPAQVEHRPARREKDLRRLNPNLTLDWMKDRCLQGDFPTFMMLLSVRVKPNLLCAVNAAKGGHLRIFEKIAGANVNVDPDPDAVKETPMLAAIGRGNLDIIEFLLDHGADPRRIVKGKRYDQIAGERKGPQSRQEQRMLADAYHGRRKVQNGADTAEKADKASPTPAPAAVKVDKVDRPEKIEREKSEREKTDKSDKVERTEKDKADKPAKTDKSPSPKRHGSAESAHDEAALQVRRKRLMTRPERDEDRRAKQHDDEARAAREAREAREAAEKRELLERKQREAAEKREALEQKQREAAAREAAERQEMLRIKQKEEEARLEREAAQKFLARAEAALAERRAYLAKLPHAVARALTPGHRMPAQQDPQATWKRWLKHWMPIPITARCEIDAGCPPNTRADLLIPNIYAAVFLHHDTLHACRATSSVVVKSTQRQRELLIQYSGLKDDIWLDNDWHLAPHDALTHDCPFPWHYLEGDDPESGTWVNTLDICLDSRKKFINLGDDDFFWVDLASFLAQTRRCAWLQDFDITTDASLHFPDDSTIYTPAPMYRNGRVRLKDFGSHMVHMRHGGRPGPRGLVTRVPIQNGTVRLPPSSFVHYNQRLMEAGQLKAVVNGEQAPAAPSAATAVAATIETAAGAMGPAPVPATNGVAPQPGPAAVVTAPAPAPVPATAPIADISMDGDSLPRADVVMEDVGGTASAGAGADGVVAPAPLTQTQPPAAPPPTPAAGAAGSVQGLG